MAEILARAVEQRQRRQLLAQGQIACRFEELTVDSPRNRFVRSAPRRAKSPSPQQISTDCFRRYDQADQAILAAARFAMDLALPAEEAGPNVVLDPQRCVRRLCTLYEKAIGGFYRLHLDQAHWLVKTGKPLNWSTPAPRITDLFTVRGEVEVGAMPAAGWQQQRSVQTSSSPPAQGPATSSTAHCPHLGTVNRWGG